MVSIDRPPWEGLAPVDPYPYEETHNLRHGPDLHPDLLGLLPLVGVWRGRGRGGYEPIEKDFTYGHEVRFSHDGRPFLFYESRMWVLDDEDKPVRLAGREVGWWRSTQNSDEVEAHITELDSGVTGVYLGELKGPPLQVEVATDAMVRTPWAKEVSGVHRLYGLVEEGRSLAYVVAMAAMGQELKAYLSAKLDRVAG
jgi:hypothetical protein